MFEKFSNRNIKSQNGKQENPRRKNIFEEVRIDFFNIRPPSKLTLSDLENDQIAMDKTSLKLIVSILILSGTLRGGLEIYKLSNPAAKIQIEAHEKKLEPESKNDHSTTIQPSQHTIGY